MHIPDGFIDAGTSAGAAAVATGGVGVALRRAGRVLDERQVPLAGMVAAFVFAAQMLNFPVAAGTSGHLLGGALAAVLVGPVVAVVCLSVVLVVQALLFADGGLSALGLNVLNIALVATLAGYATFTVLAWAMRRVPVPGRRGATGARSTGPVVVAAGVAAGVSVVVSAAAFAVEYALGGAGGASPATVAGAMLGVHVLIGVGEGIITALVVSAVLATRPDLVWGARHLAGATGPPPGGKAIASEEAAGEATRDGAAAGGTTPGSPREEEGAATEAEAASGRAIAGEARP